jgi:hypothetical protein
MPAEHSVVPSWDEAFVAAGLVDGLKEFHHPALLVFHLPLQR